MKAAGIFALAWAFSFAGAQELDDILECAQSCVTCDYVCLMTANEKNPPKHCDVFSDEGLDCLCPKLEVVGNSMRVFNCIQGRCPRSADKRGVMEAAQDYCSAKGKLPGQNESTAATSIPYISLTVWDFPTTSATSAVSSTIGGTNSTGSSATSTREPTSTSASPSRTSSTSSNSIASNTNSATSTPDSSAGGLYAGAEAGVSVALGVSFISALLFLGL